MPKSVLILALPFLAGGVLMIAVAARWWRDGRAVQGWQPVEAVIISSELKSDRRTHTNLARYRWTWDGRTYEGYRVGVAIPGGSSDITLHRARHRQLQEHIDSGVPFPARVDPRDPTQAVLYAEPGRGAAPVAFGGLLLVLVGGGLAWAVLVAAFAQRRTRGGAPWEQEGLWPDATARSDPWRPVRQGLYCASITLAVFGLFGSLALGDDRLPMRLLGAGLLTVPLAVFAWVGHAALRARRYGTVRLVFHEFPVRAGGTLRARLLCARPVPTGLIVCDLTCAVSFATGRPSRPGRRGNRGWRSETAVDDRWAVAVPAEAGMDGLDVELERALPAAAPLRTTQRDRIVRWRLVITAETPGVDLRAEFELPVFVREGAPQPGDPPQTERPSPPMGMASRPGPAAARPARGPDPHPGRDRR